MSAPTDVCQICNEPKRRHLAMEDWCPRQDSRDIKQWTRFTARGLPPESQGEAPQPAEPCAQGAEQHLPPDRIFLQWHGDGERDYDSLPSLDDVTWCKDEVFPSDEHYFHERVITAAAAASDARIAELEAKLKEAQASEDAQWTSRRNAVAKVRNLEAQLSEVTRERDEYRFANMEAREEIIPDLMSGLTTLKSSLAASETDRERLRAALVKVYNDAGKKLWRSRQTYAGHICDYRNALHAIKDLAKRTLTANGLKHDKALAPALATEGEA